MHFFHFWPSEAFVAFFHSWQNSTLFLKLKGLAVKGCVISVKLLRGALAALKSLEQEFDKNKPRFKENGIFNYWGFR